LRESLQPTGSARAIERWPHAVEQRGRWVRNPIAHPIGARLALEEAAPPAFLHP